MNPILKFGYQRAYFDLDTINISQNFPEIIQEVINIFNNHIYSVKPLVSDNHNMISLIFDIDGLKKAKFQAMKDLFDISYEKLIVGLFT